MRLLSVICGNLLLLLVGLIGLELYFGAWFDPQTLDRLDLPREQALEISIKGLYPYPTDTIRYTRDHFGLRGAFVAPRAIDLLTVGGSTTNQLFIDDQATWQVVLQNELARRQHPLVVSNAGVDGQSTYGNLVNFSSWFPNVPGLSPQIILFYVGLNDYLFSSDDDSALPEFTDDPGPKRSWLGEFRERSSLWYLAKRLLGIYKVEQLSFSHRAINLKKLRWVREGKIKDYATVAAAGSRGYAKRVRRLAAEARKMGAEPIFVTQPSRHYRFNSGALEGIDRDFSYGGELANGVDFYQIIRVYDLALMQVCREEGLRCFDLDKQIWTDEDFYDYLHMTPSGAGKLGMLLAELLSRSQMRPVN